MPNISPARYPVQAPLQLSPEVAGTVYALAIARGVSATSVLRELVEDGLTKLREDGEIGDIPAKTLREQIEAARKRGDRQRRRHRDYATGGSGGSGATGT